ncbi:MAG: hypothetical protein HYR81_02490, partial [Nitrospirae bacterium]|nr:hypothetical protein [Nitrospirota bacterium]
VAGSGLVILGLLFLWPFFLKNTFSSSEFLPHIICYLKNPGLIWLHFVSDLLIGMAYMAISFTMAYIVYRSRRDIPFSWMFLAFGLFIVACGMTHFMEVLTLWNPLYWLSGWIIGVSDSGNTVIETNEANNNRATTSVIAIP